MIKIFKYIWIIYSKYIKLYNFKFNLIKFWWVEFEFEFEFEFELEFYFNSIFPI